MRRLSSKGAVAALSLVAAGILLVSTFRAWVTGSVSDAVLGAATVEATGSDVAPGISALALALAAAGIAVVAAGRFTRVVALVGYVGCLLLGGGLVAAVLADPAGALGPVAASRVGRTGSIDTVADPTLWPWVAVAGLVVGAVGLVGAVAGLRRWAGPSARYEVPVADDGHVPGARGERVASDWDRLSAGQDPTDADPDPST